MGKDLVLSVEDSDEDFFCIEMALHDCLPNLVIQRAIDGQEAIELLEAAKQSQPESLPDLVLLDRNLPRKDGFEVLTYLNSANLTTSVPVVMFTSAATERDRRRAMELGARDVVTKPTNLDALMEELKQICDRQIRK